MGDQNQNINKGMFYKVDKKIQSWYIIFFILKWYSKIVIVLIGGQYEN